MKLSTLRRISAFYFVLPFPSSASDLKFVVIYLIDENENSINVTLGVVRYIECVADVIM